ncbi:MAG: DUF1836 domain-containing protein [Oscillospiraceae bacterium]|jgi:hypothetical protein|nr:DUF1836 domain-containing protein [Oscillospiraceae bacterium]
MGLQTLPGTTVETALTPGAADRLLTPMFLSGGLVLSQVAQLTGLEGYIIQNWIKRKFLAPPQHKRYTRRQLCRVLSINVLKDCFSLDHTAALLGYINGVLDDESDDLIDDSLLYAYFVDCLAALSDVGQTEPGRVTQAIDEVTAGFQSPNPIASRRLRLVLEIMLTAYESLQVKQRALALFAQMEAE